MILLYIILADMTYELLVDQRSLDEFTDTLEAGVGTYIKISGKSSNADRYPVHFGFRLEDITAYRWSMVK